jgi:hypothetical protein
MSSTPSKPAQAKNVKLIGHTDLDGWGDALQVVVQGNHAYVAAAGGGGPEGTTIVDISDRSKPKVVGRIPAPAGTHSHKVQVWGDLLYVNNEKLESYHGNDFQPGLRVYDLSKPAEPKFVSLIKTAGIGVHRFLIDKDNGCAYIPTGDQGYIDKIVWIMDVNDPLKPELIGKWWLPGQWSAGGEISQSKENEIFKVHGPPIKYGDYMYIGYWDAGAITLDVSDMRHPKFVARFDPSPPYMGHHHTVVPYKNADFYVMLDEAWGSKNFEHSQFMWIVDNREKTHPVPVATYQVAPDGFMTAGGRFGSHNMHEKIENDLVFVVWYNAGLRIVDVSNPYQPREVGYYIPAADFGKPAVQSNDIIVDERDGLIYITDRWGGGMHILEYTG